MNFLLFAAGRVGYEICQFFGDNREPISCLVLDSNEDAEMRSSMIAASGIDPRNVILSADLYAADALTKIKSSRIDLGILAWWPYIIKEPVLGCARLGILNFHPSYLPYNRGKNYNFWSIVEDTPFGVTIHFIDSGVDTGDIAFQQRIGKDWKDTGSTLYEKAQRAIVRLFIESFPTIKQGNIPRIPQDGNAGSFHRSGELDPASRFYLDKSYEARDLLNLLRARTFRPHPAAWFEDDGKEYEVRVEIVERRSENA